MEGVSLKTIVPLQVVLRPPCALHSQIRQKLFDSSACQADTIVQRRASVAMPGRQYFGMKRINTEGQNKHEEIEVKLVHTHNTVKGMGVIYAFSMDYFCIFLFWHAQLTSWK